MNRAAKKPPEAASPSEAGGQVMTAAEWIVRHRTAVGLVMSALIGIGAWQMWQVAVRVGEVRMLLGDEARAASEALGG